MFDLSTLALIAAVFFLAGGVKGVVGLGMPSIALGLLSAVLDLRIAMALVIAPTLLTNLWQAAVGGHGVEIIRRSWAFLIMATGCVWIGTGALIRTDPELLTALLGGLLMTYGGANLAGWRMRVPARHELWAGPVAGAANGVLTGMTGSSVVPGVMFLQAIGLPKDKLVQAMGLLFTLSTVALGLALHGHGLITQELGLVSIMAFVPALIGMAAGRQVRRQLSEKRFRQVFFGALGLLGAYLIARSLF